MKRWSRKFFIRSVVTIGGIFTIAIGGIISNRSDVLFVNLVNLLFMLLSNSNLRWIIYCILFIFSLIVIILAWQHISILRSQLKRANSMIKQDGTLLRLLANWTPGINRNIQTKQLLEDILLNSVGDFGETVLRVAILVPDAIADNLECLIALSMPQECINNMRFYIGSDNKVKNEKGGVPADVFLNGKTCIGHMMKAGDQWICRDCQGKYILPSKPYPLPLYRSFAVVPITNDSTLTQHATKCLGIIWLDSLSEQVFDSEEASIVLSLLASRIEAVLCIINKLP